MNKFSFKSIAFALLGFIFLINSCKEDEQTPIESKETKDFSLNVAEKWFTLHLKLVKETGGFTPPVAARSFGYAGLTLYESVVNGTRDLKSFANLVNGFKGDGLPSLEAGKIYNWELSANAALATFYRSLFKTAKAENLTAIDALENEIFANNSSEKQDIVDRSIAYGKEVGKAIYQFSVTDLQDLAYTTNFDPNYLLPVFPGAWVPTNPAVPKPLQPYWGNVRPFLLANVEDNILPPHIQYSEDKNSLFYLEALEVYLYGKNLSPEQTIIAKYWSDDPVFTATPPGHSISIALQVLSAEKANLALAAEVIARVGMAVHDGFVSCWKCKYVYNLLRPVTYLKAFIDPAYTTLLATPPFPEHTSGHSVQTGAAMAVLEHYFGYHYALTDYTHEARTDINGTPRNFTSFAHIAKEAAISRLYGGIHYRTAIDVGVEQGAKIGRNISDINLKK